MRCWGGTCSNDPETGSWEDVGIVALARLIRLHGRYLECAQWVRNIPCSEAFTTMKNVTSMAFMSCHLAKPMEGGEGRPRGKDGTTVGVDVGLKSRGLGVSRHLPPRLCTPPCLSDWRGQR